MTDHHRPPHPIDHDTNNRASDARYASKRPGLIREHLGEMAGIIVIIAIVVIVLVVTP
jgi:hypothetical protein